MDRIKIWSRAKVDAFWDRPKLTYEKWSEKIDQNDLRILTQSMLYMNTSDFVNLVGYDTYSKKYVEWRELLTGDDSRTKLKKGCLDSLWSKYTCGTMYVQNPTNEWFNLTSKQKETFFCISAFGYESIYQVAKRMQRNYRRVYDDVKHLISIGVIKSRTKKIKGRNSTIVAVS